MAFVARYKFKIINLLLLALTLILVLFSSRRLKAAVDYKKIAPMDDHIKELLAILAPDIKGSHNKKEQQVNKYSSKSIVLCM